MAFKVQVGPPQVAIHQGQTVLVSEEDGQIPWPSDKGLYFFDTRVVSSWKIYANGEPWELLNGGAISYYACRIFLTNRSVLTEDGTIPPRTLGLTISRSIGGGMHEDLDITNNSMKPVRFQLEIAVRCDFADIFEVKSGQIVRRGQITTKWSQSRQRLRTAYAHGDFERAVTTCVSRASGDAVYANGTHRLLAGRGSTMVRHCVRPRQPPRFAAEHPDLSVFRPRSLGHPALTASKGGGSIPRCRAREHASRTTLWRTRRFQADPAYA